MSDHCPVCMHCPSFHRWRGWTRRVGLRKSPLHFATIRMRRHVQQTMDTDFRWLGQFLDRAESGAYRLDESRDLTPPEREADLCSGPHPHCTCAYSTECCYCGDGRVHQ